MEQSDKLDTLRFLSQIHRDQLVDRRKYEWKIIFTVLTFYVLVPAAKLKDGFAIEPHWLLYASFALLALATIAGIGAVHLAHHKNLRVAERAEACIQGLLNGQAPAFDILVMKDGVAQDTLRTMIDRRPWQWIWQTIVILIFGLVSAWITCG